MTFLRIRIWDSMPHQRCIDELQKPLLDSYSCFKVLASHLVCKVRLDWFCTGYVTRPRNHFFECFSLIAALFLQFSLGMTDALFSFLRGFAEFSYSCKSWSMLRVPPWL